MNCEAKNLLRRSLAASCLGYSKKAVVPSSSAGSKRRARTSTRGGVAGPSAKRSSAAASKPKRPRSAFQLFFHHERDKILGSSLGGSTSPESTADGGDALLSEIIANKGRLCVSGGGGCDGSDRDNGGCGCGGGGRQDGDGGKQSSLQYQELARVVSRRWKALDASSRAIYDGLAILERKKFEREMTKWERTREAELERLGDKNKKGAGKKKAGEAVAVVGAKRPLPTTEGENSDADHEEPLKKKQKRKRGQRSSSTRSSKAPKKPALGLFAVPRHVLSRRSRHSAPRRSPPVASSCEAKNATASGAIQVTSHGPIQVTATATTPPPPTALTASSDALSVSSLSCCSSSSSSAGPPEPPLSPLSRAAAAVADESLPNVPVPLPPLYDPSPLRSARPSPPPLPLGAGLLGPIESPPLPSCSADLGLGLGLGFPAPSPAWMMDKEETEEDERMHADMYDPTPIGATGEEGSNGIASMYIIPEATTEQESSSSLDKESVGFLTSVFFAPVTLIG